VLRQQALHAGARVRVRGAAELEHNLVGLEEVAGGVDAANLHQYLFRPSRCLQRDLRQVRNRIARDERAHA
jgi:hypothetical protein